MFPDSRMPSDEERRELCQMLHLALLEVRALGLEGEAAQAADLADAFHNLPSHLWSDDFSFAFFRKFLEAYDQKYAGRRFNYVGMLDRIVGEGS